MCHKNSVTQQKKITAYQPSPVRRRVADFTALQHRELTPHTVCRLCIGGDDVEGTNALTVQTSVLCKTLVEPPPSYQIFFFFFLFAKPSKRYFYRPDTRA